MADEKPVEPVFDPVRCRILISSARSYVMLPGGDVIAEMSLQLGFALKEIDGTASKVHRAETDLATLRREAESDRRVYAELRAENEALKAKGAPTVAAAGRAPGVPRAKKLPGVPTP